MAKTNRKESRKIYEGYKKRQRLWNTIFVFFAVIGIGSAVLNGTMELDPQIVIGKYEFTWFHLVILAVLVVLLGFGIVQIGLSLKSHDPSQRANGFLTFAGGIIITFAREILNLITG